MRQQTRPFIVEVKRKRDGLKRNRSIWGNVDLPAIAAEVATESETLESPNGAPVDSKVSPVDVVDRHEPEVEHYMADPKEAEPVQAPIEAPVKDKVPEAGKKVSRAKAVKAQPKRSGRKASAQPAPSATQLSSPSRATRRTYSDKERARRLKQIEKSIAGGDTIKIAVKQAGISEQTYYHWKKAALSSSDGDDLKDLLVLEEENKRLKVLLAERLRKENAELKRKLGLD